MLVLSRRTGEKIVIGNGIVLTVMSTHGGNLKLGIDAPRHISVDRAEVRERKIAEELGCSCQGTAQTSS